MFAQYFYICNNQCGFKNKHSTDMAIFTLKQIVDYYVSLGGPVYICFLDASKAFDRICHNKLFNKLKNRNVEEVYDRLLNYWYSHQLFYVKWDGLISDGFKVSNGVRQGGILSPIFLIYIYR